MSRVENPEVWEGRLNEPLPGRMARRHTEETFARQEADDFARFQARFG